MEFLPDPDTPIHPGVPWAPPGSLRPPVATVPATGGAILAGAGNPLFLFPFFKVLSGLGNDFCEVF